MQVKNNIILFFSVFGSYSFVSKLQIIREVVKKEEMYFKLIF